MQLRNKIFCTVLLCAISLNSRSFDYESVKEECEIALLTQEMRCFFLETICENYDATDTVGSFMKFVDDYKNSIMPPDYNNPIPFKIEVNVVELKRINKSLFIRDYRHYYHYYMDFIGDYPSKYRERMIDFNEKYPYLAGTISISDSSNIIDYSFYLNPVIWVNVEKGSFLYHNGDYFEDVLNMAKATGGIYSLQQFSCALYKGGGGIDLSDRNIQTIAAVFYWKVLCQQAGVDFHKPLKPQAWEKELYNIIDK